MATNNHIDNLNIKEHFRVPEGYFENFTDMMMAKLPEQPFQPIRQVVQRESPFMRVAAVVASFFILALSAYTVFNADGSKTKTEQVAVQSLHSGEISDDAYTIDEAAEYAMIDIQEIHELITE